MDRYALQQSRWLRLSLLIGAILLLGAAGMWVLWRFTQGIGVDGLLVGVIAAVVPVPLLVLAFIWLGRYDLGPVRYLAFCFGWGACVATATALEVNERAAAWLERMDFPFALVPVVVAPVVEEIMKFLAPVLLWLVWGRRVVSGVTKALVYCGLSAVGFAMVENILYLGGVGYRAGMDEFGPASGLMGVFTVFIGRILMSGFAHPLFTAAAAVGLGIAARSTSTAVRWLAPIGGLLAAMVLHAAWNLMAVLVMETGEALYFLYGYAGLMVPLFLAAIGLALWWRSREGRLTQHTLPDYVRAGWLSPPEVASLASLAARHSARRWARRVAGEPGARAMRDFQLTATRLAVLRDEVRRDPDAHRPEEEQALLAELSSHRERYVGRDPQTPVAHWDGAQYEIVFPDGMRRPVPPPPEPALPVPVQLPVAAPAGSGHYHQPAPTFYSPAAYPQVAPPPAAYPQAPYAAPPPAQPRPSGEADPPGELPPDQR